MGPFIHPRSFRLKQIHFAAYLGDRRPDSRRAAGRSLSVARGAFRAMGEKGKER